MAKQIRAITDEKKSERWGKILDTAFQLFSKSAYPQVSMDQVARKAGLAKGTVYLYFKSKEQLFFALKSREYDRWFEEIEAELETRLKETRPQRRPEDRITTFTDLIRKSLENRKDRIRLIVSLHNALEHTIEFTDILDFHHRLGRHLLKTGTLLERFFPFLPRGQGVRLLMYLKAGVIGLSHVAEPSPLLQQVSQHPEPELSVFRMTFSEQLSDMLGTLLQGFMRRNKN